MIRRALDWLANAKSVNAEVNADAYELNDYELNPVILSRHDPVRGGKIVVSLS